MRSSLARSSVACILVPALIAVAGCASRPTGAPSRQPGQPCDDCLPGIVNFGKVNEKLWRGSQPDTSDPEVFRKLAQAGVKTVINLRHDHDDFPALRATNLHYLWLPMRAWHPEEEGVIALLAALRRVLADPDRWPVYVHCAEGRDRTGYAIASYRIIEQGWKADDAIHEMFDFRYNAIWFGNPDFLRRLEEHRAEVAARVGRVP